MAVTGQFPVAADRCQTLAILRRCRFLLEVAARMCVELRLATCLGPGRHQLVPLNLADSWIKTPRVGGAATHGAAHATSDQKPPTTCCENSARSAENRNPLLDNSAGDKHQIRNRPSAPTPTARLCHPGTKASSPPHPARAPPPHRHIHWDDANSAGNRQRRHGRRARKPLPLRLPAKNLHSSRFIRTPDMAQELLQGHRWGLVL